MMEKQLSGAALTIMLSIVTITGCGVLPASHQVQSFAGNETAKSKLGNSLQKTTAKPIASSTANSTNSVENGNEQAGEQDQMKAEGQNGTDMTEGMTEQQLSGTLAEPGMNKVLVSTKSADNVITQEQSSSTSNSTSGVSIANVQEIFSIPSGEVALTIDDGPSPYTEQMISVLNQYHAEATFFFIGNQVLQYPNAVRAAVASGDEIGDHTVTHPQLTHLSAADQAKEIEQGAKDIALYDPLPITLFRPPYELMNHDTMNILARDQMKLALWNRDPRDWAAKNPKQIVQSVLQGNPSGGVFDLHDKQITLEALPEILQGLQAMHLKIVVLPA